jgi:thiamine-phosphate pyrophosphorylase
VELPRLYGLTDEATLPSDRLIDGVRTACEAGLRLVQVRFKRTPHEERLRLGRELRTVTRDLGALLIVNDHPELAAELGADGAHVGAEDVGVERAREILGPDAVVGMSAYGEEGLVRESADRGATYVGLSSPFPSPTKEKPRTDPAAFARLAGSSPVPAYVVGGIDAARAAEAVRLGCHGAAVVSALFGAPDIAAATRELLDAVSP